MAFIINKYTHYCWLRVQTVVQEMHNFPSFISIKIDAYVVVIVYKKMLS